MENSGETACEVHGGPEQAMGAALAHMQGLHRELLRLEKSLREARENADRTREIRQEELIGMLADEQELREAAARHNQSVEDAQDEQITHQLQCKRLIAKCKVEVKRHLIEQVDAKLANDTALISELEEKHKLCLHSILMCEQRLQRLHKRISDKESKEKERYKLRRKVKRLKKEKDNKNMFLKLVGGILVGAAIVALTFLH